MKRVPLARTRGTTACQSDALNLTAIFEDVDGGCVGEGVHASWVIAYREGTANVGTLSRWGGDMAVLSTRRSLSEGGGSGGD